MTIHCEWTEEEIIDYVLEETDDEEKRRRLYNHLRYCQHCQAIYELWDTHLGETEEGSIENAGSPSDETKQRIMKTLAHPRSVWSHKWQKAGKPLVGMVAAVLLVFGGFWAGRLSTDSPAPTVEHRPMLLTSQTKNYRVVPVSKKDLQGYVWLNKRTRDLYMFLEGLKPLDGRDYQAWIVTRDQVRNGGVLEVNKGFAHMHWQNPGVAAVDHVIISIEPQNGSTTQTGPRTLFFDLTQ